MSPEEIKSLVVRNYGKPISLTNDSTATGISGTIGHLHSSRVLWVDHEAGRTLMGLPKKPVDPRCEGGAMIFEFTDDDPGRSVNYVLTITTR